MRLIDADALRTDFLAKYRMTDVAFDVCYPWWKFSQAIKNAPTVDVTRQLEELEEAVASQRGRADRAETFICMMCAECEWEEHDGLITMQKACGSLFPIDCGKFKLRPNCATIEDEATEESVEAAPVVQGRWEQETPFSSVCSVCNHHRYGLANEPYQNYCPNCGAKMDGDGNV